MEQQEVKQTVEKILNESHIGTMATVKGNKPSSRYMMFKNDDLTLYTATSTEMDKTKDLEQNPYAHIILGYDGGGFGDGYVEYEGKVTMDQSEEMKKELWNEYMEQWFDGPEDPNYVVLKIDPVRIQLMNKDGFDSQVLEM